MAFLCGVLCMLLVPVALRAYAAGSPTPDDLFALPLAIWPILRSILIYVVMPGLFVFAFFSRPLALLLRNHWPQFEYLVPVLPADGFLERLSGAQGSGERVVDKRVSWHRSAASPSRGEGADPELGFPDEIKQRMAEVHRSLRNACPEALPLFADYRALQNRLLAETALRPATRGFAYRQIAAGLTRLEFECGKVSVVLPGATKEYDSDNCCALLERLAGEAMGCLSAIRSAEAGGSGSDQSITGETQPF